MSRQYQFISSLSKANIHVYMLKLLLFIIGGMKSISRHTFIVAQYFHHYLQSLHHGNSQQVADIYCHGDFSDPSKQGPIVNFNLKRSDGSYIGFAEVLKVAENIKLNYL